ncbi:antitoxin Xre/MbcA/ParS toxin-binding domain-containing protein [Pseudomonas frederiksbergensis]|uniref:antitoxin Xre/MbcA/ParS toxin-binding domain-containing protein n=1 Tax=Pseudomonas frederiksbergensis TaxID=104087 RepID=UPI003CFC18C6
MIDYINDLEETEPLPKLLMGMLEAKSDWSTTSKLIRDGLPSSLFNDLSTLMGLAPSKLARLIGVKPSARRRWLKKGVLNLKESDYFFQSTIVLYAALGLFEGDKLATQEWLKRPALALGQKPPAELLSTFVGMKLVETFIWKIENGVAA